MTDQTQPDMTKVRAFLAKKQEQDTGRGVAPPPTDHRTFHEEDGSVHYAVSINGRTPVATNLPPVADRIQAFAANNLHWQTLTYETMSLSFGLELNPSMGAMALYNAITEAISEMDDADKAVVPKYIWDAIGQLQKIVHGDVADIPNLRGKKTKPPRATICPIRVEKLEDDTVAIFPVGDNRDTLSGILDSNLRWNHYRGLYPCDVRHGNKDEGRNGWIVIKCDDFAKWPDADHVKALFASFDKPVDGRLVGVND